MEHYEITVKGHLGDHWRRVFHGLQIVRLPRGMTRLTGDLPDQAALHGILDRILDLGIQLLSVKRREARGKAV